MAVNANISSNARNTETSTRFNEALTPFEFVAKYGPAQHVMGESKEKHRLALTVKDKRGVLTTAYASEKLQAMYEACKKEGKKFALPKDAMVAPWTNNQGGNSWVLYLQADIDLSAYAGEFCEQF